MTSGWLGKRLQGSLGISVSYGSRNTRALSIYMYIEQHKSTQHRMQVGPVPRGSLGVAISSPACREPHSPATPSKSFLELLQSRLHPSHLNHPDFGPSTTINRSSLVSYNFRRCSIDTNFYEFRNPPNTCARLPPTHDRWHFVSPDLQLWINALSL